MAAQCHAPSREPVETLKVMAIKKYTNNLVDTKSHDCISNSSSYLDLRTSNHSNPEQLRPLWEAITTTAIYDK